jgi:hypothetical protein
MRRGPGPPRVSSPALDPIQCATPSPLSSSGNAQIDQVVTFSPGCFGPVVLVRVFNASAALGSQLSVFIAETVSRQARLRTRTRTKVTTEMEAAGIKLFVS